MKPLLRLLCVVFFFLFCLKNPGICQVGLALDTNEWRNLSSFEVRGRQGILIKQKLSFGNYYTNAVKRSWTREASSFRDLGGEVAGNPFYGVIQSEYIDRNQTLFFSFRDSTGQKADVQCVSDFKLKNITFGNTGISLSDLFGAPSSSSAFYVQIYLDPDGKPWQLVLDNHLVQERPKEYSTKLIRAEGEYYTVSPYRFVRSKKGKLVELSFGAAGFVIRNSKGDPVAAVSTINKGIVHLTSVKPEERFLLAAACTAILLQEQAHPGE